MDGPAGAHKDVPETGYAPIGDGNIAYQVLGTGPPDMLFMSAWFSHVDGRWEEPAFARFLRRLASFSRLILFDKRGSGASDPLPGSEPTWEDWADDIRAVLDAVGTERAAVVGVGDSGPMAMLFAAGNPSRVSHLVLANTGARFTRADDYPPGLEPQRVDEFLQRTKRTWGTGGLVDVFSPSRADDERYRRWWAKYQRMGASPGASVGMARLIFGIDVRHVLPVIGVPTLVLHRKEFQFWPVGHARYLAERIHGAKYVELSGEDGFLYLGDSDAVADEIQEFVVGVRPVPKPDRMLATVMFTDIVGSTDRAMELGDRRWREVLDAHDGVVQRELAEHRGTLLRTTGDGAVATFDGPARSIDCAFGIREGVRSLGIDIRCGLHAGEVEVRGNDVAGIAFHIGARIMSLAGPGQILASSTIRDLTTGADIRFVDRGEHALKGLPTKWHVFEVAR